MLLFVHSVDRVLAHTFHASPATLTNCEYTACDSYIYVTSRFLEENSLSLNYRSRFAFVVETDEPLMQLETLPLRRRR